MPLVPCKSACSGSKPFGRGSTSSCAGARGLTGTVPTDGHAGEGSPHAMAAFLVALLVRAVMKGVSGNNQVKFSTRRLHPDNLSLCTARPPRRQRVAAAGRGDEAGWSECGRRCWSTVLSICIHHIGLKDTPRSDTDLVSGLGGPGPSPRPPAATRWRLVAVRCAKGKVVRMQP